jgi:purine nucleosidase/pyrimidine-specific ribonucleoside hydrolase
MTKVILDTDIGDDIDDVLALGLVCASPELELVGVTTVFGNVLARARQARTVLAIAGERFARIPVTAGCGASMASRPNHGTKAYLEDTLPNQDPTCLPESELPPLDKRHAVNFLIDTIMAGDGDIVPVTIGAMTNLAAAMVLERRIVAKIPRIVAMAAEFKRPFAEWNVWCDPEAAQIVFNSGIPIEVTPWDIGHTVRFDPSYLARLNASSRPLARRLAAAIAAWQSFSLSV